MKHLLKIRKDDEDKWLYGFYNVTKDVVGVNLEKIWLETKNINKFIDLFVETITHENLHRVITKVLKRRRKFFNKKKSKISEVGEEWVVQYLNGETNKSFNEFIKDNALRKKYSFKTCYIK